MVHILEQLSVEALVNAGYKQSQKAYVQRMDAKYEWRSAHPHHQCTEFIFPAFV